MCHAVLNIPSKLKKCDTPILISFSVIHISELRMWRHIAIKVKIADKEIRGFLCMSLVKK